MKGIIDPGRKRPSINFIDSVVYSHQKDLNGTELELEMSIMLQNGNSEMRAAAGVDEGAAERTRKPVILWVPGGGYRGVDKNTMIAEMIYLAEAGYVVASMYYRSSAQGKFPAQIEDVKTAVRFLRANADLYEIDPEHIGVMGRSAGGHLAAMAAMNDGNFLTEEWQEYSSDVQACYDMFGPVDFVYLIDEDAKAMKDNPNHRWKTIEDTHAGAVIGGDPNTIRERAAAANVRTYVNPGAAPILIMHGDADPLVTCKISEEFYKELCDAGLGDQTDFYLVKNAGHGTPEFFQDETKQIVTEFFDRYLK